MATFNKYIKAEETLTSNGFNKEMGTPLSGVRFRNDNQFAFVKRMGENNYQIFYYDIITTA